jgi:hypothetical protein
MNAITKGIVTKDGAWPGSRSRLGGKDPILFANMVLITETEAPSLKTTLQKLDAARRQAVVSNLPAERSLNLTRSETSSYVATPVSRIGDSRPRLGKTACGPNRQSPAHLITRAGLRQSPF